MQEVKEKLKKYGQEQLLRFYEELEEKQQQQLLEQIKNIDFELIEKALESKGENKRGSFSPIPALTIDQIEERREEFERAGLEEIRAGHVGAVLLAGGMGTRLGSDNPKGMYNIGLTKDIYIFQCLIGNLFQVVDKAGEYVHLFIMTSEKNDRATRDFFEEKEYFGYKREYIHFFIQEMAAATDFEGKAYLEEKGRVATSPNGNGGWYISMKKCGLAAEADRLGIRWLNIFAVDNVLQKIADPLFVGACLLQDKVCGAKVIRKAARDEKVGVMCNEDGHPSIVEYYEMTDEMMDLTDEKGERLYNFGVILNYIFRKDKLDEITDRNLPLHVVDKKIPYVNDEGRLVNPQEPNGHKYEQLVLDMISLMDNCLVYEVVREKEFAPIKNKTGVDSVDSARRLLQLNGVTL